MTRLHLLIVALLVSLLAGGPAAAAQVATPDPTSLPEARAPFGLGGIALPGTPEEVEAVFGRLPPSVAGEQRQPWLTGVDRVQVPYGGEAAGIGHPMVLGAIDIARGDFFPPDFTAGDYVAMSLGSGEFGSVQGGRDGEIAWLQGEIVVASGGARPGTPAISTTMTTVAWGAIDRGWIFTAIADSPGRLEALVEAFVAAAGGDGPVPDPGATPATGRPRSAPVLARPAIIEAAPGDTTPATAAISADARSRAYGW
jgi:hypothetical protein